MTDTTDTDDLTPAGEGTPLGEAEPSREWKDERIKELGGVPAHELRWLPRGLNAVSQQVERDDVAESLSNWGAEVKELIDNG